MVYGLVDCSDDMSGDAVVKGGNLLVVFCWLLARMHGQIIYRSQILAQLIPCRTTPWFMLRKYSGRWECQPNWIILFLCMQLNMRCSREVSFWFDS